MPRPPERELELQIFPAVLHMFTRRKDLQAWFVHVEDPELAPSSLGFTRADTDSETGIVHIGIYVDVKAHKGNERELLKTQVHESIHAAGMILDHVLEKQSGSSETFPYLAEFIFDWIRNP